MPGLLLRLVADPDHEPFAAPKLNVVTINKALRLRYGFVVVAAHERLECYEMPIITDPISPVICHRCSGGRSSPVRSLLTSVDRNGSSPAQSRHWNLRPPVFHSRKRIGLRHLGQMGGGVFLDMGIRRITREHRLLASPNEFYSAGIFPVCSVSDSPADSFWSYAREAMLKLNAGTVRSFAGSSIVPGRSRHTSEMAASVLPPLHWGR